VCERETLGGRETWAKNEKGSQRLKEKEKAKENKRKIKKRKKPGFESRRDRIRERKPGEKRCLPSDAESKTEKVSDSNFHISECC
jgi:hypothetical protein